MNFVLINSALLGLGLLVGVPLLVHLLARSRPKDQELPTLRFLRKVMRETMRVRRPQDWLLLLLRTLLVAALILAFWRPVYYPQKDHERLFERKDMVLVIDASASMAYVEGAQTRFAKAGAEAGEVLNGLKTGDRANVVWVRRTPQSLLPELSNNTVFLKTEVQRGSVSLEAGNVPAALALAEQLLTRDSESNQRRKEICLISDFQATQWKEAVSRLAPDIHLVTIPIWQNQEAPNATVREVWTTPAQPIAGQQAQITVEIENFSPSPLVTTVDVQVEEAILTRRVSLQPWARTQVAQPHVFQKAGQIPMQASLGDDQFPADDTRWRVADVQAAQKVLLIAGETGDPSSNIIPEMSSTGIAEFWERALRVLDWVELQKAPRLEAGNAPGPETIVMIADMAEVDRTALGQFVNGGGTAVIFPNDSQHGRQALGMDLAPDLQLSGWQALPEERRLKVAAASDPALALFAEKAFGDLGQSWFRGRIHLALNGDGAGLQRILDFDDGMPALARVTVGEGRVVLWNLPLAREHSNLARTMEYVPLLAEVLLQNRPGGGPRGISQEPGDALRFELADEFLRATGSFKEVHLTGPNASDIPLTETGRHQYAAAVAQPGLYTWTLGGEPIAQSVVNLAPAESDLRALTPEDITSTGAAPLILAGGGEYRRMHEGIPLWPWLIAAAIAFALLEGGLTVWSRSA